MTGHATAGAVAAGAATLGLVLNVHANGPVNDGIERYRLRGAEPRTTYSVALTIWAAPGCTGQGMSFPTADLTTNGVGNGNAGAVFSAATVAPLVPAPAVLNGMWTFNVGGVLAYKTSCEQISVDVPPSPKP